MSKNAQRESFLMMMDRLAEIAVTVALSMPKQLDALRVVLKDSLPLMKGDAL